MPASPPIKYKKEFVKQAEVACRLGATRADLAQLFNVSLSCLNKWMVKYPDLKKAYDTYREVADAEVERSLYERARGYSCVETDVRAIDGVIVKTEMVKHFPPDPVSMIFWLKNRKPKDWTDKKVSEDDSTPQPLNITFETREPVKDIKVTNAKS